MPLFVLSPASLVHSALFAGFYSYLSANVVVKRLQTGVIRANEGGNDASLSRAVRAHASFFEYTPFSFALLFLAELNGAPTAWVHAGYTALFATRLVHTVGLLHSKASNVFRKVGFFGTLIVMLATAGYNFGLGYEPLKSFLGVQ
ncbi:unnamed protein product [Malassezia sympodialis ATCC 42132]|uniref:Uncharacterized protein n=1 Tax=Malassezia sympodialis (strain ATCC 42132) TaxID=1230383 RepID=M5EAA7_MALS4|nr:uncharacterized protein MSY001_2262 [Malassezia sympodialis ATCC 42132]CCU99556.1 unnamed protein product [Malassezia sympodialis ATCC 42132]SHO78265.1 Uncharacterized protein MSYG_2607 [Malassezia sympodialis ATCC 42132]|eukprot:XP_018740797.1 uncharacterized protein MSY001_2262 [Malassezia sympodialis ATCC 42132]